MDFRVGIVIGASLLLVSVQSGPSSHACTRFTDLSEPCGCTLSHETFDPICGSDGHTYMSVCFLECQMGIDQVGITIDYKGVCSKESRCTCLAGYAPMCGNNGVTYSNECVFNCFMKKDRRIQLKHSGNCRSVVEQRLSDVDRPGPCRCRSNLRSYYTRFGGNGQRYARSSCGCRIQKEKLLTVQSVQPASEPSNRVSNNNQIKSNVMEKFSEVDSKKCVCAAIHKPVCANNHMTYANFCVLHCLSKKNPGVKLRHWGDCKTH